MTDPMRNNDENDQTYMAETEATEPILQVQVKRNAPVTDWLPARAVTFGRDDSCDIVIHADVGSSRHMGTFVHDDGCWYLVNPVAKRHEVEKRPIIVTSFGARWRAEVDEGGWIALLPGAGTIRPYTTADFELIWRIDVGPGEPIGTAAQWENERIGRDTCLRGTKRPLENPDHPVLHRSSLLRRDDVEDWEHRLQALDAELATPDGIMTRPLPRLGDRVVDFLVTAAWLTWENAQAPLLTYRQVAAIWSTTNQPVNEGSVQRAIKRGLEPYSRSLPDPIVWSEDPSRALTVLRRGGALTQRQFDWQDLGIEYPEDLPDLTPRADGTVGPRLQANRPIGWTGH